MFDLGHAIEILGILPDHCDQLVHQLAKRRHAALAEIQQAVGGAVAHRPPAVLLQKEQVVAAPAAVADPQPPKHADQAYAKRRQANGVLGKGAKIEDARFQRGKAGAGAHIPPDHRGILDHAGAHQRVDMALVVAPTAEFLRKAGARQAGEDRQAETVKPRVVAFPERRGHAQRQQMGQEIAKLVHQIHPQVLVLDPHVDMHAANQHAAGGGLHFLLQGHIALRRGLLLVAPQSRGMGGRRDDAHSELLGHGVDLAPLPGQFAAHFRNAPAHLGGRFHLRAHQLVDDLAGHLLLAGGHEPVGRIHRQLEGFGIDEEVLLFHAQREARLLAQQAHRDSPRPQRAHFSAAERGAAQSVQSGGSARWIYQ